MQRSLVNVSRIQTPTEIDLYFSHAEAAALSLFHALHQALQLSHSSSFTLTTLHLSLPHTHNGLRFHHSSPRPLHRPHGQDLLRLAPLGCSCPRPSFRYRRDDGIQARQNWIDGVRGWICTNILYIMTLTIRICVGKAKYETQGSSEQCIRN